MIHKEATGPETKNKILFWCTIMLLMNMTGPEIYEKSQFYQKNVKFSNVKSLNFSVFNNPKHPEYICNTHLASKGPLGVP